ncbi:hypothetical protein GGI02_000074 [Coemansia sp. RSA 2322]|nr:hypothetical protein GGI02_000074 [Coemansia sp. RSA 2322]
MSSSSSALLGAGGGGGGGGLPVPEEDQPLLFASNYAFPLFDPSGIDMSLPSSASHPTFGFDLPLFSAGSGHDALTAANHSQLLLTPSSGGLGSSSAQFLSAIDGLVPTTSSASAQTAKSPRRARSSSSQLSGNSSAVPVLHAVDEGIRQYFAYVHPWLPMLHRPTFERQVVEGRVDPLLYYAVQAIAARFTNPSTQRESAKGRKKKPYKRGRRFARAARALLPQALKGASLTTLQAITLLAQYASVSGEWQEGAALEKLAVQLAFIGQYHLLDEEFLLPPVTNNFGLYESGWSGQSHPARLEVLSRPGGVLDHEQRRRAWWSVFQLERFNGLAMGRPPIIKPGWHWVWLPCNEDLWARDDPCGPLAWEMGLAASPQRPDTAVSSNCRVDLVLALIMGQVMEQRMDMFRMFFPRVDRGTLFYDNLPTHDLGWAQRLQGVSDGVAGLERRIRQWHSELDKYADEFSARRHANFELMGSSCLIHLYACVLQVREHLFEDLLISEDMRYSVDSVPPSGAQTPRPSGAHSAAGDHLAVDTMSGSESANGSVDGGGGSRSSSTADFSALFERHTGQPFEQSAHQRGYMAKAKRPELTMQFVRDLDVFSRRCWDRSVAAADETARLLRVYWLRVIRDDDKDGGSLQQQQQQQQTFVLGGSCCSSGSSDVHEGEDGALDPLVADRFKSMNPQTPYHLFIAGKVQAARLKQAVTAQARRNSQQDATNGVAMMDGVEEEDGECPVVKEDGECPVVKEEAREAVRRINDIWDKHGLDADAKAIESRLDVIITALEYCQLYWFSLNFASHLKYLKREAAKPLLDQVYRK